MCTPDDATYRERSILRGIMGRKGAIGVPPPATATAKLASPSLKAAIVLYIYACL